MAAYDTSTALGLMKARLNRLQTDTSLDEYFTARLEAADQALTKAGITLTDSTRDMVLVVDMAVWQYQNRDKPDGMPEWLRLARRERWLNERVEVTADDS
jgi:hypothetical protein